MEGEFSEDATQRSKRAERWVGGTKFHPMANARLEHPARQQGGVVVLSTDVDLLASAAFDIKNFKFLPEGGMPWVSHDRSECDVSRMDFR